MTSITTAKQFQQEFERALAEEEGASEAAKRIREAAPYLLAALKKLAVSHLATIEGEGFDPEHCVCSDLDDAFAAIAQAEGRSP